MNVTYDRPVGAALHVHLTNGETWEATDQDLVKFGLVNQLDAYMRFRDRLAGILRDAGLIDRAMQLTGCELNPLRHLAELAIAMPDLLDHPDNTESWQEVADLERRLRTLAPCITREGTGEDADHAHATGEADHG